jgi:hypothetical protein
VQRPAGLASPVQIRSGRIGQSNHSYGYGCVRRIPVVLTPDEVSRLLARINGVHWLVACLQYGSGLHLIERVRLRVMDIEFGRRAVTLADELVEPLQRRRDGPYTA